MRLCAVRLRLSCRRRVRFRDARAAVPARKLAARVRQPRTIAAPKIAAKIHTIAPYRDRPSELIWSFWAISGAASAEDADSRPENRSIVNEFAPLRRIGGKPGGAEQPVSALAALDPRDVPGHELRAHRGLERFGQRIGGHHADERVAPLECFERADEAVAVLRVRAVRTRSSPAMQPPGDTTSIACSRISKAWLLLL